MTALKEHGRFCWLPKIAEYDGKKLKNYNLDKFDCFPNRKVYIYLVEIGADTYIGSTDKTDRRFCGHLSVLKRGKSFPKLQEAFDRNKSFNVYLLFCVECRNGESDGKTMEQFFINLLRPTLNVNESSSQENVFSETSTTIWRPIDVVETYYVDKAMKRNDTDKESTHVCPHCGKEVTVTLGTK